MEIEKALDYLYRIPTDDDNYVAALVKIADLYQFDNDFETAISKLEEAVDLSDDPLVTFALAESLFANADYQRAITEYAKLSERKILHHTKVSIYERIGESYAQLGNFENAISFLEKSYGFDAKADTQYKIAILYAEIGNLSRAISAFKKLDKADDDYLNYELAYAQALHEDGQNQEALKNCSTREEKKSPFGPFAPFYFPLKISIKRRRRS
ncbi:tetratricopeptide repeat protein [Lactococcus fujiensis]|uniref:tetratricopeptide repeat protein n=1 Tax=Lactococcus fujiensis TaxID=610251 RepID=UPI0020939B16|nr:tetratricopeptide repeat protein [Lactococcus fujiensis]